ncbi:hypothetical protein IB244_31230 [Rhizobium sp. RHZ02]|uniref:hypothetical protein n=1 Tax=Rhizobium sp. RHZ02 TaxID=2769306 RepID=UPI00177FF22A|nr:hypothetical protein [Rhizobium sp. RHZ02]MBD9455945.1 hypothetical protein [Rhizobium sp. RHZ02]
MPAVIARIALRYLAGALIAKGYLDAGTGDTLASDPDLLMLVGLGIGALTELAYVVAHRMGWAK